MKKFVALMLSIVLLGTMFVMTGCARKTTVEFTVEGINDYDAKYVGSQKITWQLQRQEDPNNPDALAKYTFVVPGDGDYEMMLWDMNNNSYPFTLKIHNGKVEAETSEGVTVTATVK